MSDSTLDTVRAMAELARLELDEREARALSGHFERILEHFRVLASLPVEGVEPMLHAGAGESVLRDDQPVPGLAPEAALANAPERWEDFYKVPKTVGGDD
jgi:aspartyl-tRNA(Asn)/glutamyl-tRNA(Gln) amidotransferase subunit C